MGAFSEEEKPWNGGQFESDFEAWQYIIVGSGLPGSYTLQFSSPVIVGSENQGVIIACMYITDDLSIVVDHRRRNRSFRTLFDPYDLSPTDCSNTYDGL